MPTNTLCVLIWGNSKVAGTLVIAAPGASYAVDFSRRLKNAELLPPAAADSATGKIDEHREDEMTSFPISGRIGLGLKWSMKSSDSGDEDHEDEAV